MRSRWSSALGALILAFLGGEALAQMPPAFQVPPPVWRTRINAQLYCGEVGRCPTKVYQTVFTTTEAGDVYATDSGLTFPLNRTAELTQPPLTSPYGLVGSGQPTKWTVSSTFGGNVLTLLYKADSRDFRSSFKMRIRFHLGLKACEVLAWEAGGQSGRFPLAQAYIDGTCDVGGAYASVPVKRTVTAKRRPKPVARKPSCVEQADTPCPELK
jgi:hypothetical protein